MGSFIRRSCDCRYCPDNRVGARSLLEPKVGLGTPSPFGCFGGADTLAGAFRCGCRGFPAYAAGGFLRFAQVDWGIPRKITTGICTLSDWVHIVAESSRKTPPNKPFSLPPPPTSVGGLSFWGARNLLRNLLALARIASFWSARSGGNRVSGRSQPASQLARSGVNRAECSAFARSGRDRADLGVSSIVLARFRDVPVQPTGEDVRNAPEPQPHSAPRLPFKTASVVVSAPPRCGQREDFYCE
jgi:hypothetical protein